MKRKSILGLVLILIFTVIWLIWFEPRVGSEHSQHRENAAATGSEASSPVAPVKQDRLADIIATEDVAIEFYGVVMDPDGKPLENVEVEWDLLKAGAFAPSIAFPTGSRGKVMTDAAGKFTIANQKGLTISIESLKYTGYHSVERAPRSFGYRNAEPHLPDPAKPVRFVMIKDGGKRSLKLEFPLKFDWDGNVKEFSMGPKGFPNKIILIPTRQPLKAGERIHQWKLVIKVTDGQLFKAINDGISVAPESGYLQEIVLEKDKDGQWGSKADALIYLKMNTGLYAEMRLSAYSDRGLENSATGYVDIRWNPDGGRVFE